jgi:hypothetical protein
MDPRSESKEEIDHLANELLKLDKPFVARWPESTIDFVSWKKGESIYGTHGCNYRAY